MSVDISIISAGLEQTGQWDSVEGALKNRVRKVAGGHTHLCLEGDAVGLLLQSLQRLC